MNHYGDQYNEAVPYDVIKETPNGTYMARFDRHRVQRVSRVSGFELFFDEGKPCPCEYSFKSCNYTNSKGTATYKGITYDYCLKMESNTQVSFTTDKTITFVVLLNANGSVKVDGVKRVANADGVVNFTLEAGSHAITKDTSSFLFYIDAMRGTELPTDIEEQAIWSIRFVKTETDETAKTSKMEILYPNGSKECMFVLAECETYDYQFAL